MVVVVFVGRALGGFVLFLTSLNRMLYFYAHTCCVSGCMVYLFFTAFLLLLSVFLVSSMIILIILTFSSLSLYFSLSLSLDPTASSYSSRLALMLEVFKFSDNCLMSFSLFLMMSMLFIL